MSELREPAGLPVGERELLVLLRSANRLDARQRELVLPRFECSAMRTERPRGTARPRRGRRVARRGVPDVDHQGNWCDCSPYGTKATFATLTRCAASGYAVTMGDIERAKVGKWEKIGYWPFLGVLFPSFLVTSILQSLGFGFWQGIGVALLIFLATAYLLFRPAQRDRAKRLAADLERGVFDCAVRYPNAHTGSLRDRWDLGGAQYRDGRLLLQSQNLQGDLNPVPVGGVRDLRMVSIEGFVGQDGKLPAGLRRGWKVLEVKTEGGAMHFAAGEPGLTLLQERQRR